MDDEKIGSPMVPAYWKTINEYWDWVAQQGGDPEVTTMEQAMDAFPEKWAEDDEYWGGTEYDSYAKVNASGGVAGKVDPGMEGGSADAGNTTGYSTAARDIKDNPKGSADRTPTPCSTWAVTATRVRHARRGGGLQPHAVLLRPEDQSEYGDGTRCA